MMLVPFFEIPRKDRLAENVKSRCVQMISRSAAEHCIVLTLKYVTLVSKSQTLKYQKYLLIVAYKTDTAQWEQYIETKAMPTYGKREITMKY